MDSQESQVWRGNRYVANTQQLEAFLWFFGVSESFFKYETYLGQLLSHGRTPLHQQFSESLF